MLLRNSKIILLHSPIGLKLSKERVLRVLIRFNTLLQEFLICLLLQLINISLLILIEKLTHFILHLIKEVFIILLLIFIFLTAAPLLIKCSHLSFLLLFELFLSNFELPVLLQILLQHNLLQTLPLHFIIVFILDLCLGLLCKHFVDELLCFLISFGFHRNFGLGVNSFADKR